MKTETLLVLLTFLSSSAVSFGQEPSSTTAEVQSAVTIPSGYEIGENSFSPDKRFAILYPVRDDKNEHLPPNLLVCLKPYSVLSRIGDDDGRWQGARGEPRAKWNGNSVVAIWVAKKWGMADLAIYEIKNDQIKRIQPIWREVRTYFDRDFRERFSRFHPDETDLGVTFVSGGGGPNAGPEIEFKGRKLFLNLFADNKPNLTSGPHWTAQLHGIWNIDRAEFEKVDFRPGPIEIRGEP